MSSSKDSAYKMIYSIVFICFLLSGASGLIYEVIWTRMLTNVFGGTTLAVSTVLTVFLGGLAVGSYFGGKYIDHVKKPLLTYGLLELAIGIYGLLVPFIFSQQFLSPVWHNIVQLFESVQFLSYIVRFIICIILLALPTVMMGATLPVLSRYLTNVRSDIITLNVGMLYTINTFGAILGTFLAGFVFLPNLGVTTSIYIAVSINLLLAIAVILLAKLNSNVQADTPESYPAIEKSVSNKTTVIKDDIPEDVIKVSMLAFAVSGFVALVFEVVWTRVLTLVLGSSTYAFSTMLTTFLTGLALGAAVMTKLQEKLERPVFWTGVILCAIGVSGFLTSCFFNDLPWLFLSRAQKLPDTDSWLLLTMVRFVVCSAIMFMPTFLSGMIFPLVIRIYSSKPDHIGESVGKLYSLNTLGSIIGSFSSGFIFIPLFGVFGSGIQTTSKVAIIVAILMGLLMIFKDTKINPKLNAKQIQVANSWVYIGIGLTLFANIFLMPQWDKSIMTTGVAIYHALSYKTMTKEQFFNAFKSKSTQETIKFYKEGLVTVVTITATEGSNTTLLKNNGKVDAGTPTDGDGPSNADMITQILLGQLPLLLHKGNPENVLVVGLGSGCTTGSVVRWPSIKSVKVCEIEKAVIDGDKYFEAPEGKDPLGGNGAPLNPSRNPLAERVKAINTDGRNYLLTTAEKFDIIISQPADPWVQGASALFTKEFWELGAKHLKPGGLFCEWIQLYSITPEYLGVLVNTFKESFGTYENGKKVKDGYVYLFRPGLAGEVLLIGSNDPLELDIAQISDRLKTSFVAMGSAGKLEVKTKDDLARVSIKDAQDIASQLLLGNDQIQDFVTEQTKKISRLKNLPLNQRINTDDNVIIEFEAPKKLHLFYAPIPENIGSISDSTDGDVLKYFVNYGETPVKQATFAANLALKHIQKSNPYSGVDPRKDVNLKIASYLANKSLQLSPTALGYFASYQVNQRFGKQIESQDALTQMKIAPKPSAEDWIALGQIKAAEGDLAGALGCFRSGFQTDSNNAEALSKAGEALFGLAIKSNSKDQLMESLSLFQKGRTLDPYNVTAWSGEGNVYFTLASTFKEYKNIPLAEQAYLNSFMADINYWPARLNYGKLLYGQGPNRYNEAVENLNHLVRRLNPQNPEARYIVGKILQYQGNLNYAYQYLQSAIQTGLSGTQLADAQSQLQNIQIQIQQGQNPQQQQQTNQVKQSEPSGDAKTEAAKKLLNIQGNVEEKPSTETEMSQ